MVNNIQGVANKHKNKKLVFGFIRFKYHFKYQNIIQLSYIIRPYEERRRTYGYVYTCYDV